MTIPAREQRGVDAALALLLMAGTVTYLVTLPHNLGMTDESNFLYEAKRLGEGEVMYRDVFDIISPVSLYFTAFVFHVFGTDMSVARAMNAIIHAVITVTIYAGCRLLRVRAVLAALAAAAHIVLLQPAWPFVSQHWFATAAMLFVLLSLLRTEWPDTIRWPLLPGALTGLLIGIQHQRGAPLAVGLCGLFVAVHLCRGRYGHAPSLRVLIGQLVDFALGVTVTAVPPFAILLVMAGLDPMVRALVTFPLVNYRRNYRSPWGGVQFLTAYYAQFTYPALLRWAPVTLASAPLRCVAALRGRKDLQTAQQMITLFLFALVALTSIAYYPDFVHIAFIAPVFLIGLADGLEWSTRWLPTRSGTILASLGALAIMGLFAVRLQRNFALAWSTFPVPYDSVFGRIDLPNANSIPTLDKARELLSATPNREMFCYPAISAPYLMTGARNPTPYQFTTPNYRDADQLQEIIGILDGHRTPLVLTVPLTARKQDPIVDYVNAHYDYVDVGMLPNLFLHARKPE